MAYVGGNQAWVTEGLGEIEQLTPGNPAAGVATFSMVVPATVTAEIWLPHSLRFTYNCDGNAANRMFVVNVVNTTPVTVAAITNDVVLVANDIGTLHYASGYPTNDFTDPGAAAGFPSFQCWLWPWIMVIPGNEIRITIRNNQVGDQLADVILQIQKWRINV